jgi:hypothetical protein
MHSLKASAAINRMQHIKLQPLLNPKPGRLSITGWRDGAQEMAGAADGCWNFDDVIRSSLFLDTRAAIYWPLETQ